MVSGNSLKAFTILPLSFGFNPLLFANDNANNINPASWSVKALVETNFRPAFVKVKNQIHELENLLEHYRLLT